MNFSLIRTASAQVLTIITLTALLVNVSSLPGYTEPASSEYLKLSQSVEGEGAGENTQPSQPVEGEQTGKNTQPSQSTEGEQGTETPQSVSNTSFMCGMSQGSPATVAQTPRGIVPVIVWNSNYFSNSGFNPTTRCQKVSDRFQRLYASTHLNFLTAGTVNNLQVICATDEAENSCNTNNILFTLKPGESALRVIKQLQNIRAGAGGPLHESTRRNHARHSKSINVNDFLNYAPVDSGASIPTAKHGMFW